MKSPVAYLVNQYPKVSHSFIRREIQCLESLGLAIHRFSIRSRESELVDEQDKAEFAKTRILFQAGVIKFFLYVVLTTFTRPIRCIQTLRLLLQLNHQSDRSLLHHIAYFAEACVLLKWCQDSQIAHVHAHFGTNSTTVALLCYFLGGPTYSFTVHGPEEFDKVYLIGLQQKIEHSAFVVAISSFGRSQLYRWCNHDQWSKIHIVRCGVDDQFLNHTPIPFNQEARIVCVGRLCEQKGQFLLVEACHQLALKGRDFKLTLVGDGEQRADIETLIDKYSLSEKIEITGWASAEDVKHYIQSSRAMVLPSFAEGLPVVIMEALALHRPVISTYVAGIPELVCQNECGWLVPSGSIEALTSAIELAIDSPIESLEKMGHAGADAVAKAHTAIIEAGKLADLFDKHIQPNLVSTPLASRHNMASQNGITKV